MIELDQIKHTNAALAQKLKQKRKHCCLLLLVICGLNGAVFEPLCGKVECDAQ